MRSDQRITGQQHGNHGYGRGCQDAHLQHKAALRVNELGQKGHVKNDRLGVQDSGD